MLVLNTFNTLQSSASDAFTPSSVSLADFIQMESCYPLDVPHALSRHVKARPVLSDFIKTLLWFLSF